MLELVLVRSAMELPQSFAISPWQVKKYVYPSLFSSHAIVVGGGDTAAEEATYLTRYASKVFLLVRRDQMRASKAMQERVRKNSKVEILWNTIPTEAVGDGRLLNALKLRDTKTGEEKDLQVNGLFYAIGHVPNTLWLKDSNTNKFQVHCGTIISEVFLFCNLY